MNDVSARHYQERYETYLEFEVLITHEYPLIADGLSAWIEERFSPGRLRALDVGAGTGRMPRELEARLSPDREIIFDYLDPAIESLTAYRETLSKRMLGEGYLCRWEDFHATQRYDLIIANNALCGLDPNDSQAIARFRNLLAPNGASLLTLPAARSDWVRYARKLWPAVHRSTFAKTIFEDVADALEQNGIPFDHKEIYAPVTITRQKDLETIFSAMMYVDKWAISTQYREPFARFVACVGDRANFYYGIARVLHD